MHALIALYFYRNKNLELLAVQLRSRLEDDSDVELARFTFSRSRTVEFL